MHRLAPLLLLAAGCGAAPQEADALPVAARYRPAGPAEVRLLDGPFREARDRHAEYLLALEPDRLLARFRAEAGLPAVAEGYGGWEADEISGHSLGHYLSGVSRMYAGTGDARFLERAAAVVAGLAECQRAEGDGYVAAIPEGRRVFEEVRRGDIRTANFDLNGIWVPWYTLHKQLAGLRDAYLYCGLDEALTVAAGLADWALWETGPLDAEQLDLMLRCEHGGMNEVAADLAALTGEGRYLELSARFHDRRVLEPLARGEDVLPGLHGNTQVPKLIGAARWAELTGDAEMLAAARFFWDTVTARHSYANGGNTLNEYFGEPGVIGGRLNGNTSETCNSYNMLRLARQLQRFGPDARRMEHYERTLYNHVLASQDRETGAVCYYVPLRPASRKPFQRLFEDFTCCVGSGMESHASYGDAVYTTGADGLWVDLFVASELRWPERGLRLVQRTRFPDAPSSELELRLVAPRRFALHVRRPQWAGEGFALSVNGEPCSPRPGADGYVRLERLWRDGDRVRLSLPMPLRFEPSPDDPAVGVVLAGPVVLAGDLGPELPAPAAVPCLVTDETDAARWLEPVPGETLTYRTVGAGRPGEVVLRPFFRIREHFYNFYWQRLGEAGWEQRAALLRAAEERRRALEARTSDFVQPGEMQPERDHDYAGSRSSHGIHNGLRWRDAHRGGWFGYTLRLPSTGQAELVCTYWGSDTGGREFDVVVDGTVVATETLDRERPGEFFDRAYPLPAELTAGKATVRVEFRSHPGRIAGGVFGIRVVGEAR